MKTHPIHLLTGVYATDALEPAERRAFERHLGGCRDCQDEVADLRETLASMAEQTATAPPHALRAKVLAARASS